MQSIDFESRAELPCESRSPEGLLYGRIYDREALVNLRRGTLRRFFSWILSGPPTLTLERVNMVPFQSRLDWAREPEIVHGDGLRGSKRDPS